MDDYETGVTHLSEQKPCCCSSYEVDFTRSSKYPIRYTAKGSCGHLSPNPERSVQVAAKCGAGSLNDEVADKLSNSDHSESNFGFHPVQYMRILPRESNMSTATLREEELLDALLLLSHIGLAPNFKQGVKCRFEGSPSAIYICPGSVSRILAAFESNEAATLRMPKALLAAFDN